VEQVVGKVNVVVDDEPSVGLDDLSRFDAMQDAQEAGLDVDIRGPDNKKLGFSIKISGPDSLRQRRVIEKIAAERMNSDDPTPLTPQELFDRQTRGLAGATISWTPFNLDGEKYVCSEENAYKLYNRFPFIRDQVAERAGRRSAFFESSSSDAG
jgi:hypothetical protein